MFLFFFFVTTVVTVRHGGTCSVPFWKQLLHKAISLFLISTSIGSCLVRFGTASFRGTERRSFRHHSPTGRSKTRAHYDVLPFALELDLLFGVLLALTARVGSGRSCVTLLRRRRWTRRRRVERNVADLRRRWRPHLRRGDNSHKHPVVVRVSAGSLAFNYANAATRIVVRLPSNTATLTAHDIGYICHSMWLVAKTLAPFVLFCFVFVVVVLFGEFRFKSKRSE